MPVHNADVAAIFNEIADLLELEEANPFRVRAYRSAARVVGDLSRDVVTMVKDDADLTELPGVGEDLAEKIRQIVTTGRSKMLSDLHKQIPPVLTRLLAIPGLGPKRIRTLHHDLHIQTVDQLARAARAGRVHQLPGFGEKTEQQILQSIETQSAEAGRVLLAVATQYAEPLAAHLKRAEGVKEVGGGGSYRRRKETLGDLDILVTANPREPVLERLVAYDEAAKVLSRGSTRATVFLRTGLQVDLPVVGPRSFGSALYYFTGSKAHNIAVRKMGQQLGLKINEYGVFRNGERIAGATEQSVFASVDLPYIPPELREDHGEIEAAGAGRLPCLVELADLRGDLHCHTDATDGRNSLREMAEAAQERGFEYLAITDHSRRVTIARGLDAKRFLKAMDHPHFHILAHPTGRLLLTREPYEADLERILRHARQRGCFLEVDSHPERLDLTDLACRMARDAGVLVSIDSDAHTIHDFNNLRFGVDQARRGWLEKSDILNARPLGKLRSLL